MAVLAAAITLAAAAQVEAEADFCSRCDTSGLRYRLLRGEGEAAQCLRGVYCDCDLGRRAQCFASVLGRRFNEATQRCEFNFDCQAWLAENPAADEPARS